MPKGKNKIEVTPRDIEIFRVLFEHKSLTTDQIHRDFFSDVLKRRVNFRLKKLFDHKFIGKKPIIYNSKVIYYWSLTPLGLKNLIQYLSYQVVGKELKSYCPIHDSTLYDIRKCLERRSGVLSYTPENVLQNSQNYREVSRFRDFYQLNCDATAEIRMEGETFDFAIEFERRTKSRTRNRQYLTELYNSDIEGAFYICENQETMNALMKVEKEVIKSLGADFMVRYALLSKVLDSENEILFKTAANRTFILS